MEEALKALQNLCVCKDTLSYILAVGEGAPIMWRLQLHECQQIAFGALNILTEIAGQLPWAQAKKHMFSGLNFEVNFISTRKRCENFAFRSYLTKHMGIYFLGGG